MGEHLLSIFKAKGLGAIPSTGGKMYLSHGHPIGITSFDPLLHENCGPHYTEAHRGWSPAELDSSGLL